MRRLASWSTIFAGVFAGCCGWPSAVMAQMGPSAQPAVASETGQTAPSRVASPWNVLGRSVEDRVIEYRQFGDGPRQVLVVGPLDGDETSGIDLAELLADHLERFPRRASGAKITLVRDPNPDGRLRRSAYNARGVRLDQNFPTRGWRKVPSGTSWLSGREPDSEPETRALVDLVADVRPDLVIILAATRRRAELTYCGPAEELAREFAQLSGLRPSAANITAEQGSLAVYTGADRQTPTLVVRVLAGMRRDHLWTTYKRALLAIIGDADEGGRPTQPSQMAGSAATSSSQPWAVLAATKNESPNHADAARGKSHPEPRVLTADELQFGGNLAPVSRPPSADVARKNAPPSASMPAGQKTAAPRNVTPLRREFGPAARPNSRAPRTQGFAVPYQSPGIRPTARGGFPPANLARPSPNTVNPLPTSTAPPRQLTAPGVKMIERLPAVQDSAAPPRASPQAIPLYPETGY